MTTKMEYYYTNKSNISDNELIIKDKEAHHLKNVLRKNIGDGLFVTDGERNLYKVKIISIDKDSLKCSVDDKLYNVNEPDRTINLYLALLKNPSRFEFAIEKCVEIGVNEITPIITEHVINKKSDRIERWQSISLAAMKQSQRCYLPIINQPIIFNNAIQNCTTKIKLLADERETCRANFSLSTGNISLFIGPEGGFSSEEVELAEKNSFQIISLGKRKLRSETSAIVGITKMLYNS